MDGKRELIDICHRMHACGFAAAHDGNVSFLENGYIFITQAGISKDKITEKNIACIGFDGISVNGITPSSEYRLHVEIYKNTGAKAVVHTHPPYAVTFACLAEPLDPSVLAEAEFQLGSVPLVPYSVPGSAALAEGILPYLNGNNALLLEKHGLVTWSETVTDAFFKTETAEFLARVTYNIRLLR